MSEFTSLKALDKIRFRDIFIVAGGLLTILLWLVTDPNAGIIQNLPFGASTIVTLAVLLRGIWFIALLHIGRRALLDYLDLKHLFVKAEESAEGAGLAIIGVGVIMLAIAVVIVAATVMTG